MSLFVGLGGVQLAEYLGEPDLRVLAQARLPKQQQATTRQRLAQGSGGGFVDHRA